LRKGRRPKCLEFEPQSSVKKTFKVPDSVAVEFSWRVKAALARDPHASRNDLFRQMLLEYAERHPLEGSPPTASSAWPDPGDERFTRLEVRIPASMLADAEQRVLRARDVDPCFIMTDHIRRVIFDYFKRHPFEKNGAKP